MELIKNLKLVLLLSNDFKNYINDPLKIISGIANDSKNTIGADLVEAQNIVTGLNNIMTRDHATILGRKFLLKCIITLLRRIEQEIKDINTDMFNVYSKIKSEMEATNELYINMNTGPKLSKVYSGMGSEERIEYFINRLERDFIKKLNHVGVGFNLAINLNKLILILRTGFKDIKASSKYDKDALLKDLLEITESIKTINSNESIEISNKEVLELIESLNTVKRYELSNNSYKLIGNLLKELALKCQELETMKLRLDTAIPETDTDLKDLLDYLNIEFDKITVFTTNYYKNTLENIPNAIENIENVFNKFENNSIGFKEYENSINRYIKMLTDLIKIDTFTHYQGIDYLNEFKTKLNNYNLLLNLFSNMLTYRVEEE